jgi:hypothetical protein
MKMHLQQSEISTDSKVIHYLKYLHICFNMTMHLYVIGLHKMPLYLVLYLFFKFIMGILIVVTENYSEAVAFMFIPFVYSISL